MHHPFGELRDNASNEFIRPATLQEYDRSMNVKIRDGQGGPIVIEAPDSRFDGRLGYVVQSRISASKKDGFRVTLPEQIISEIVHDRDIAEAVQFARDQLDGNVLDTTQQETISRTLLRITNILRDYVNKIGPC